MRYFRFWLGRLIIHAGLGVFPEGRCKRELTATIALWASQVRYEIDKSSKQ